MAEGDEAPPCDVRWGGKERGGSGLGMTSGSDQMTDEQAWRRAEAVRASRGKLERGAKENRRAI